MTVHVGEPVQFVLGGMEHAAQVTNVHVDDAVDLIYWAGSTQQMTTYAGVPAKEGLVRQYGGVHGYNYWHRPWRTLKRRKREPLQQERQPRKAGDIQVQR